MSVYHRITAFMENFAGYGNPKAALWFVGMEERGDGTVDDLKKRVDTWAMLRRKSLEDLRRFHQSAYPGRTFDKQKTWRGLTRLLLAWRGEDVTEHSITEVQKCQLGTIDGDTALVELMPLPAPNTREWPYESLEPHIPELRSRSEYRKEWKPRRIESLRQKIDEAKPKAVVFYGTSSTRAWKAIAETTFQQHEADGIPFQIGRSGETRFAIARHPAARGVTLSYWDQIGECIRKN